MLVVSDICAGSGRVLPRAPRRRGIAMVLVVISVAIAMILSLTYLQAQSTATGMADSMARRAKARALAESGLAMMISYVHTNQGWRMQLPQGAWITDQSLAGGTFTITGEDGLDTDGDGIVEGDGNIADDENDPVTITATGRYDGAAHVVKAVLAARRPRIRVLLLVPNPATLNPDDQLRKTQFLAWEFDVALIGENDDQATFNAAFSDADVMYIPRSVYSVSVQDKIAAAPVGVVLEEGHLNDAIGMADLDGGNYTGSTQINVTDNAHFITAGLPLGAMTIVDSTLAPLRTIAGILAPDAKVLAGRMSDNVPVLAVVEAGDMLIGGGAAAGRRVTLPWAGGGFNWSTLNDNGLDLLYRALVWAGQPVETSRLARWTLNDPAGTIATDVVGGFDGTGQNGVTLGALSPFFETTFATFDGVDDFIEVPHNDAFLLDEGTVALWFKTYDTTRTQGLISKDSSGFDTGGHLSIFVHDGNHTEFRLQSWNESHKVRSADVLTTNTWYHLAVTFGPGGLKMYLDGTLVDTGSYTGGMGLTSGGIGNFEPMAIGLNTMSSGDFTTSGGGSPLTGAIEDIQVFDRALSAEEINDLIQPLSYSVRWIEASDLN